MNAEIRARKVDRTIRSLRVRNVEADWPMYHSGARIAVAVKTLGGLPDRWAFFGTLTMASRYVSKKVGVPVDVAEDAIALLIEGRLDEKLAQLGLL